VPSQILGSRVANLAFLKPDFEILAFFEHLCFFGNKKAIKIWLILVLLGKGLAFLVKNGWQPCCAV